IAMSTATTPAPAPPQPAAQPQPVGPSPAPPGGTAQSPALAEVQKPGYATTEFWLTLFSLISVVGVGVFHWNSQQAEDWTRIAGQVAPILAMVIGFLITRQYVNQRGDIKQMLASAATGNQLKALLGALNVGGDRAASAV